MHRNKKMAGNTRTMAFAFAVVLTALVPLGMGPQAAAAEGGTHEGVSAEERQLMERALPKQFLARPAKARKLLIFDRALEFRHAGIPYANLAFTLLGEKTGAFSAVVSNDPAVFASESIKQYDAVLFNDTTGNLFEDLQLRRNLLAFVEGGGGLMGLHAAISAFVENGQDKWPEFGEMLGGRGAGHNMDKWGAATPDYARMWGTPGTCYKINANTLFLKAEDPGHPVARTFGDNRRYTMSVCWGDEILHYGAPFSRDRVRVILRVDADKPLLKDLPKNARDEMDYPAAWVRSHGKGRVFYCSFGHNPHVFWQPKILEFFLAATQFVVGDLPGSTTPSEQEGSAQQTSSETTGKNVERYTPYADVSDEEWQLIERALPAEAPARPSKPRKLLIFDRNKNERHPSIPHANLAFTRMGEKTGAFTAVVSQDPAVFASGSIEQYDAVFFNNTSNILSDPQLRRNLAALVENGGGLMALHAAITSFPDWPEYGTILGARGANHRVSMERVVMKVEDPSHPVVKAFGGDPYTLREEFFRFGQPYPHSIDHVLLSFDKEKTDLNQGHAFGNCMRDEYPVAWVRSHGKGRVFYCTFGHNSNTFWQPKILEFFLAATQFALGDLPGATQPSVKPTAAPTPKAQR